MEPRPDNRILKQSLRANQASGIIYLNNPKAGCSTIKASLWKALGSGGPADNVHALENSPFRNRIDDPGWAADAFVFTFVRNPYVRIVSSYLNKIAARRDKIWPTFAHRHGCDPDAPLGFDSFVECIAAEAPAAHDPHWRAQAINTLAGYVTPNFLGRLENMNEQLPRVLSHLFPGRDAAIVSRNQHGTGAARETLSFLRDKGTIARLHELYGEDFERFGYSPDVSAGFAPRAEPALRHHRHPSFANLLRDAA